MIFAGSEWFLWWKEGRCGKLGRWGKDGRWGNEGRWCEWREEWREEESLYKESSSSWEDCVGEVAEETVLVSTAKMWLNMMGEASDFANTRQLNSERNKGEARTKSIGFCEVRSEALTNLRMAVRGSPQQLDEIGYCAVTCICEMGAGNALFSVDARRFNYTRGERAAICDFVGMKMPNRRLLEV